MWVCSSVSKNKGAKIAGVPVGDHFRAINHHMYLKWWLYTKLVNQV